MYFAPTLLIYLGRQFLIGIGLALFVLLSLVILFDIVELLRRASGREAVTFGLILQMASLKLPFLAQKVLPFATLFGGTFTFLRLSRTQELIVARSAGVSVWQFLMPAFLIAILVGIFVVTVFNPLTSVTMARYEQLDSKLLRGRSSMLAVSPSGLWLRQADPNGQSVIHARTVARQGAELEGVIIFLYEGADRFIGRIDARRALLTEGSWQLEEAMITRPEGLASFHEQYNLATTLTPTRIQDSFASPESMSFWALPQFIDVLEAAGFTATKHRLHWHSVLAGPVLLGAMVLIAATFSLRLSRYGGAGFLVVGSVSAGFLLYFLSDLVYALGLAGSIPVLLAAWAPAVASCLLGLAMLFHFEDG